MKPLTALIALCALAPLALAQDPGNANIGVSTSASGKVTISSKGRDVRDVLYDLFHQSKKNFVIVGETRGTLYLNLADVDFTRALNIILEQTGLKMQDGGDVVYIGKDLKTPNSGGGLEANIPGKQTPGKATTKTAPAPDLALKVNVKLTKVTFKDLLKEFTDQTGVDFVLSHDVKEFRLDADLKDKSLKYALDLITKSAGLQYYALDSGSILVELKVN